MEPVMYYGNTTRVAERRKLLSSDLLQVLESTQNYDVLIKVGGGDNLYAEDFNGNNGNDLLEEEFMLEKTLNKCIPLIRYFHISGDDYFKKVFPFKRILPKSLKKDIYGYFLSANYRPKSIILPPRISPIDSTIVTNKHASMIEFWMQNLINSNITIGTTIINNSNPINPITNHGTHSKRLDYDWNLLCGYHPTEDSFIFSMNFDENNNFDKCCKLNRVKNSNFAIYHDPSRGPTFGYPDLSISDR
ncbi:8500_t:CDS:2 [Entrophospora sp. SA101]|nr:8500_t:CDS:2 [Entrophospora sp. SA101]